MKADIEVSSYSSPSVMISLAITSNPVIIVVRKSDM